MSKASSNQQNAIKRLELIKKQLNTTPSVMSIEAPKDMARERASASFDIKALSHVWMGSENMYNNRVRFFFYRKRKANIHLIFSKKRLILLKMILNWWHKHQETF